MDQINFLPQSYIRSATRKSRRVRQVVLVGIFVVTLGGWFGAQRTQTAWLSKEVVAVERQATAALEQRDERVRLDGQRSRLMQQLKLVDELSQPIQHTQVISAVNRLIPPSMALTDLRLDVRRPRPASAKSGDAGSHRSQNPETAAISQITLDMEAITGDPLAMPTLITQLREDPLFEDVQLRYSRAAVVGRVPARKFRLGLTLDLDRTFRFVPSARDTMAGGVDAQTHSEITKLSDATSLQEVAHVDH